MACRCPSVFRPDKIGLRSFGRHVDTDSAEMLLGFASGVLALDLPKGGFWAGTRAKEIYT